MRMLYWPWRSPFRRSNRFPGKSESVRTSGAASSMSSFRSPLALYGLEAAHRFPAEEPLRIRTAESPDHLRNVYCYSVNVKQYDFQIGRAAREDESEKSKFKTAEGE